MTRSAVHAVLGQLLSVSFRPHGGRMRVPGERELAPRARVLLAITTDGRIRLAYAARRTVQAVVGEDTRQRRALRWGLPPDDRVYLAAEVAGPPWQILGPSTRIVYTTEKGTRVTYDWEHEWGEGAPRGTRFRSPTLVRHHCGNPNCADAGKLALRGGTYRVTERGIVG